MLAKNILEEFEAVTEYWSPKIIGELNGQYLKIAKIKGEFVWHDHADEDEMFWVIKGEMDLRFRDKTVHLGEGDIYIIAKGVEHNPIAENECWIVLLEPKSTKHTGDIVTDATKSIDEQLNG